MTTRHATAEWTGQLKTGKGTLTTGSGVVNVPYTFASRFESGLETNPEELVGSAHAGCYAMFLSALVSEKQLTPTRINATSNVTLGRDDTGPRITKIELVVEADIPGLDQSTFTELAEKAKQNCPISRLYAGTDITLVATLV